MKKGPPLARPWALDLTDESYVVRRELAGKTKAAAQQNWNPPGWLEEDSQHASKATSAESSAKQAAATPKEKEKDKLETMTHKAWEMAFSPGRNVLIMGGMMFMTGSQINIFTIGTVLSVIFMQVKSIRGVNDVFKPLVDTEPRLAEQLVKYKFIYVLICGLALCMAAYKGYKLGILPVTPSDWTDLISIREQDVLMSVGFRMA